MAIALHEPIVRDERGVPHIAGTSCKVVEVVRLQTAFGYSPEELHDELPHVTISQIRAALRYYESHQDELDADIEDRRLRAERRRDEAGPSPVAARLRAAGKLR